LGKGIETEHIHLHQPQELMILFEESTAGGLLDSEERKLLSNSLQLRQLAVRQVMIPRNRMLAAEASQPCDELLALLADSPYSRLPLFEESVDNVVGIVHLKDLLCLRLQTGEYDARKAMRPVLFVPANMPVDEVFAQLQRKRYHVAIVLDEYGGTEGMVTLEDLIEEIFGEIQDEFDIDVIPPIKILSGDTLQVRGDTLIEDLNQQLDFYLPSEDVDTIGGLILNELGHVPMINEQVELNDVHLIVDKMDGKGVTLVKIKVSPEQMKHIREIMQ
jgi:CBS domain containing-hemolysin-like protein